MYEIRAASAFTDRFLPGREARGDNGSTQLPNRQAGPLTRRETRWLDANCPDLRAQKTRETGCLLAIHQLGLSGSRLHAGFCAGDGQAKASHPSEAQSTGDGEADL